MPFAQRFSALLKTVPKQVWTDPLRDCHPKQAAAVRDESTYVAMLCGRRAGKTTAALNRWHILRRRKPGCESLFVALTRDAAKGIAWSILKKQNAERNLGLVFNETELTCTDGSGSTLKLIGANRDDLLDVIRGRPFLFVAIDEAAFYRLGLLQRLIEEVIEPSLIDYSGQLLLLGTPGLTKTGYFYRATSGQDAKWSMHAWTMLDNTFLPNAAEWLLKKRSKEGWSEKHPVYQREYLGQWAWDPSAQVYPIDDANVVPGMPDRWRTAPHEWVTVLGIDYGVRNATAHALLAYNRHEHCVYVVASRRDVGMLPTEATEVTRRWQERYQPVVTVGDAGGLGKVYVAYANLRGGLAVNVENAKKLDKRGHQEWLRDALLSRPPRFLVCDDDPGNRELIAEMQQLQWEPKVAEDPQYHMREDPRGRKDICDSVLYAFVECHAYFPSDRKVEESDPDDGMAGRDNGLQYLA